MLAEVFGVDGIIVLIVVVVLLFGGAAIPKLARNLGSAKNEFEKGLDEGKKAAHTATHVTPAATSYQRTGGRDIADHRARHADELNPSSAIGFEGEPTMGESVRHAQRGSRCARGPRRGGARGAVVGPRVERHRHRCSWSAGGRSPPGDSRRGSTPFVTPSVPSRHGGRPIVGS